VVEHFVEYVYGLAFIQRASKDSQERFWRRVVTL